MAMITDRPVEALPEPEAAVGRVGLLLAMASMTILFSALAAAYIVRRGLGGWWPIPVAEMQLLWVNTAFLVATSGALVVARGALLRRGTVWGLAGVVAAGLLGTGFLVGQVLAWLELRAVGVSLEVTPAGSFFYLITALHGLHVLGGMGALVWSACRLRATAQTGVRADPPPDDHDRGLQAVELTGFYWHFLLAVWLALFTLMALA